MAWSLVPDRLLCVFRNLPISWDFHAQQRQHVLVRMVTKKLKTQHHTSCEWQFCLVDERRVEARQRDHVSCVVFRKEFEKRQQVQLWGRWDGTDDHAGFSPQWAKKNVGWSDECGFVLRSADGRVRIWHQQHESMDPTSRVSTDQAAAAAAGVMMWGMISLAHFRPLNTNQSWFGRRGLSEYCCCPCASLYGHDLPASNGSFQRDNEHRAGVVSQTGLKEHDRDLSELPTPPRFPWSESRSRNIDGMWQSDTSAPVPAPWATRIGWAGMDAWINTGLLLYWCYSSVVSHVPFHLLINSAGALHYLNPHPSLHTSPDRRNTTISSVGSPYLPGVLCRSV